MNKQTIIDEVRSRFNENLEFTKLTSSEKNFFEELSEWAVIYTIDGIVEELQSIGVLND